MDAKLDEDGLGRLEREESTDIEIVASWFDMSRSLRKKTWRAHSEILSRSRLLAMLLDEEEHLVSCTTRLDALQTC